MALRTAPFRMVSDFSPAGDQPAAVAALSAGIGNGERYQTLLGITGSCKSATIAWTIEQVQKPTLVIAPNKSLAAQLANEFREFFPDNRVEYFVSYYDYYQPEAYIASSDTYIEKDSSVNDEIDRLRHSATSALLTRRDVIVVASVSCIYGLGSPDEYRDNLLYLRTGTEVDQRAVLRKLVDMQYERNDMNLVRGKFRVRGDTIELHPAYDETAVRIELFGDEIERMTVVDPLTGEQLRALDELEIYPANHYAAGTERMQKAIERIEVELADRLRYFEKEGKLLEAQRLRMRTQYDLEMMQEVCFCSGIENYSAPIDGRGPGEPPHTLLDFFPDDYLLVIDESHVAVPQLHGQYEGDRTRKEQLIEHGFRLPSAADNRPLRFEEFVERVNQVVFLSATPADHGADRRPAGRDRRPHRARPAGAGHHAHQEDGRGPHRLPARAGAPGPLPALQHRHDRADRDPPRPPAGRVRRAGRHQPAAGGARPAGGVTGRHPRRRQGGLPPVGDVADPDDRPGGPKRRRPGGHV